MSSKDETPNCTDEINIVQNGIIKVDIKSQRTIVLMQIAREAISGFVQVKDAKKLEDAKHVASVVLKRVQESYRAACGKDFFTDD